MKKYILLFFSLLIGSVMYSQTGINTKTPDASAALDVESINKGMLIPRMTTAQKIAIPNPNEGLIVYDTDKNCVSIYTFLESTSALGWTCLTSVYDSFFYMPSINIDTSTLGTNRNLDLYYQYGNQPINNFSPGATTIETYTATDLYYYVTYYDKTKIKINSISVEGVMNYDVIGHANYDTYMNVIFVIK